MHMMTMTLFPAIACAFVLQLAMVSKTVGDAGCNGTMNGAVRLGGFSSPSAGAVEICVNGTWATFVTTRTILGLKDDDEGWTVQDATVACNSLGYQSAAKLHVDYERFFQYASSNRFCLSDKLECTGREGGLMKCKGAKKLALSHCNELEANWENALVLCKVDPTPGEVRLVGSTLSSEGIVEVYSKYYGWSTLCTDGWDDTDATVVCRSLGYQSGQMETTIYSFSGLPPKRYNQLDCSGTEDNILDCPYVGPYATSCYTAFPARLSCSATKDNYGALGFSLLSLAIVVASRVVLVAIICLLAVMIVRKKCNNDRKLQQEAKITTTSLEAANANNSHQYTNEKSYPPPSYDYTKL